MSLRGLSQVVTGWWVATVGHGACSSFLRIPFISRSKWEIQLFIAAVLPLVTSFQWLASMDLPCCKDLRARGDCPVAVWLDGPHISGFWDPLRWLALEQQIPWRHSFSVVKSTQKNWRTSPIPNWNVAFTNVDIFRRPEV